MGGWGTFNIRKAMPPPILPLLFVQEQATRGTAADVLRPRVHSYPDRICPKTLHRSARAATMPSLFFRKGVPCADMCRE